MKYKVKRTDGVKDDREKEFSDPRSADDYADGLEYSTTLAWSVAETAE